MLAKTKIKKKEAVSEAQFNTSKKFYQILG